MILHLELFHVRLFAGHPPAPNGARSLTEEASILGNRGMAERMLRDLTSIRFYPAYSHAQGGTYRTGAILMHGALGLWQTLAESALAVDLYVQSRRAWTKTS